MPLMAILSFQYRAPVLAGCLHHVSGRRLRSVPTGCIGLLVGLLLGFYVGLPARAQAPSVSQRPASVEADLAPYQLVLDHITGVVELRSNQGRLLETWERGTETVAPVPPDRPLMVVVKNANTLLYTYVVSADNVRTTPNQSCRAIGRQFGRQSFLTASIMT